MPRIADDAMDVLFRNNKLPRPEFTEVCRVE